MSNDIALTLLIEASDVASPILTKIAQAFGPIGVAAVAATASVVGMGVEAVKMAGNFQTSTSILVTSAGEIHANIGMVRQGILDLSVSTATSTQQLVQGMFNIESAGYHGAAGLQILTAAAQGARAEGADLASVTQVLTTTMHDYAFPTSQAVAVMDSFITTVANGQMHMNDLTGALKNVLPVASAMHIGISDVQGALDTMSMSGDKGATAGTHLAMMFKMLSNPASTARKEMEAMGIDSVSLAQTMQTSLPDALAMIQNAVAQHFVPGSVQYNRAIQTILGGSKSGIAGLELLGNNFQYLQANTEKAAAALRSGGKDVENWTTVQGNLNFRLDQAKAAFDVLMITIGTKLLPVVTAVVQYGITPLIQGLTWLVDHGGQIVDFFKGTSLAADALKAVLLYMATYAVLAFLATLPEMIAGLWGMATAAWAAAAGMTALDWPILLVVAAVAALIAIVVLLYQHWTEFRNLVNLIGTGLQVLAHWVGQVFDALGTWVHSNVVPWLQLVWNWIAVKLGTALHDFWDWLYNKLGAAFSALGTWISGTAIPALSALWDWLSPKLGTAFSALGTVMQTQVLPALQQFWNWIQAKALPALQQVWDWLSSKIGAAFSALGTVTSLYVSSLQILWNFLQTHIIPALQTVWDWLSPKLGAAFSVLGTAVSTVITVLQKFWNVVSANVGPVLQQLWLALQNLWNVLNTQLIPTFQNLWQDLSSHVVAGFQTIWNVLQTQLIPSFQMLWALIQLQLTPILNTLWQMVQQQLLPYFQYLWQLLSTQFIPTLKLLWQVIQPLLPDFQLLAAALLGLLSAAIGTIAGIIGALTGFVTGLATIMQGVAAFWQGIEQIFQGALTFIHGLLTLNLSEMLQGMSTFGVGLENTVSGFLHIIQGVWQSTFGAISQGLGTFFSTAIGIFQHLTGGSTQQAQTMNTNVSNAAKQMDTNVTNSMSHMQTSGISSISSFSTQGSDLMMQLEKNGQIAASSIDSAMQQAFNDVAGYVSKMQWQFDQAQAVAHGLPHGLNNPSNFAPSAAPGYASGVQNFSGGLAYVHQGEVLMNLAPGTSVIPANRVSISNSQSSGGNIYITAYGSTKEQIQQISDALDKKWGRKYRTQYGPVANGGGTL